MANRRAVQRKGEAFAEKEQSTERTKPLVGECRTPKGRSLRWRVGATQKEQSLERELDQD